MWIFVKFEGNFLSLIASGVQSMTQTANTFATSL